jgi:hypothetical protein
MAGGPSIFQANRTLSKSLKATDYTAPTTLYVALFTTSSEVELRANNLAGSSEVPFAGAYQRVAVANAGFTTSTAGSSTISGDAVFPSATAAWGNCQQAALMDAATAGNILYFGPLTSAANIQTGDSFKIPAGTFVINA